MITLQLFENAVRSLPRPDREAPTRWMHRAHQYPLVSAIPEQFAEPEWVLRTIEFDEITLIFTLERDLEGEYRWVFDNIVITEDDWLRINGPSNKMRQAWRRHH